VIKHISIATQSSSMIRPKKRPSKGVYELNWSYVFALWNFKLPWHVTVFQWTW